MSALAWTGWTACVVLSFLALLLGMIAGDCVASGDDKDAALLAAAALAAQAFAIRLAFMAVQL